MFNRLIILINLKVYEIYNNYYILYRINVFNKSSNIKVIIYY